MRKLYQKIRALRDAPYVGRVTNTPSRFGAFITPRKTGLIRDRPGSVPPDLQAKLDKLVIDAGRAPCELVEDAVPDMLMSWPRHTQNAGQPVRRPEKRPGEAHQRRRDESARLRARSARRQAPRGDDRVRLSPGTILQNAVSAWRYHYVISSMV